MPSSSFTVVRSEVTPLRVARRLLAAACAAWCCGGTVTAAAQQSLPSGEQLTIGVVTFGRGDEVHQYFGHNAFVVHVAGLPDAAVFNYGMFKFGPDMIPNFLHGRLEFWVGTTALEPTARSTPR